MPKFTIDTWDLADKPGRISTVIDAGSFEICDGALLFYDEHGVLVRAFNTGNWSQVREHPKEG